MRWCWPGTRELVDFLEKRGFDWEWEGKEGSQARSHSSLSLSPHSGHDVFNALDILENGAFLEDLKFGIGDGQV